MKNSNALVDYAAVIQKRGKEHNTAGSTLPLDAMVYRMIVTHALLKSGLPCSVLDHGSEIRNLLEDGHCSINKCHDIRIRNPCFSIVST